jgi:hypothetical protein
MTAVMGALSHTRPASARNLELGFSSVVKLPYFIAEAQIAKPPVPELVSYFLKYFLSSKESLILQYQQFLFENYPSGHPVTVDCPIFYLVESVSDNCAGIS